MFQFVNLPNFLSVTRILCTPLFIWFLFKGGMFLIGAIVVFTLAAFTDSWDGYIARRYGRVTEVGSFLDPLADKIFIFGTFFSLQAIKIVPGWFVITLIVRDLVITLVRIVMVHQGRSLVTSKLGKWKTAAQFFAIYIIFLYLFCHMHQVSIFYLKKIEFIVQIVLYLVTGLIVFSGIDYLIKNKRQLLSLK